MSKVTAVVLGVAVAFFLGCDNSSSSDSSGEGGPEKSPVNIEQEDETLGEVNQETEAAVVETVTTEEPAEEEGEVKEDEMVGDAMESTATQPKLTIDTGSGEWYSVAEKKLANGETQEGIVAYQADQNLYVTIADVTEEGWYSLAVTAKNYGALGLADFYTYFNIAVINETTGKAVGGIFIKASDSAYNTGSILVYLTKGDTKLNLLWNNDAYKQDTYETNIQIKTIAITKSDASGKKTSLSRSAQEYSSINGRFFWDDESFFTYWSDQIITYTFPELTAGKYQITLYAKNKGTLPRASYKFEVHAYADGVDAVITIPGSDKKYKQGSAILDLTGGTIDLELTWTNDEYQEGEYDTNIQVQKFELKRIGNSERSALTAYLMGISTANKILIMTFLFCLIVAIAGITVWNRKRVKG